MSTTGPLGFVLVFPDFFMLIFFPPSLLAFDLAQVGLENSSLCGRICGKGLCSETSSTFSRLATVATGEQGLGGWQRGRPGAWALPRTVPSSSSSPIPVYRVLLAPHPLPQPPSSHTSWGGEESGWQGLSKGPSLHSRDLESQGC